MYRIVRAHLSDCPILIGIWEEAVLASHHFLSKEDFEFYRSRINGYLDSMRLFAYRNTDGTIDGFMGLSGNKLEMLFVRTRGAGVGKALLDFAVNNQFITSVDVNSQNERALEFYKKNGFRETGSSPTDAEGKPYPITHLTIEATTHPHMGHGRMHPAHGSGPHANHPGHSHPHSSEACKHTNHLGHNHPVDLEPGKHANHPGHGHPHSSDAGGENPSKK